MIDIQNKINLERKGIFDGFICKSVDILFCLDYSYSVLILYKMT